MMDPHDRLARLLTGYFQEYLVSERNVSPHTVLSYRDALKLFLLFMKKQTNRSCTKLRMQDVTAHSVRRFLNGLEQDRGNSVRSRNHRLAALRCLFEYVARNEPRHAELCAQIVAIPIKRDTRATAEYLETDEIRAIFDQIDRSRPQGLRDYALLLFLYNTGARVGEAAQSRHLSRTDQALLREHPGEGSEMEDLPTLDGHRGGIPGPFDRKAQSGP